MISNEQGTFDDPNNKGIYNARFSALSALVEQGPYKSPHNKVFFNKI